MRFLNNKKLFSFTPVATMFMIESANIQQVVQMFIQKSSEGQSISGWICIIIALLMWANFYRLFNPEQKMAFWSALVGVFINTFVVLTIIYFRYIIK